MNADIKKTLSNTFGIILCLGVIFFFFIYILYLHNEVHEALKEAWTVSLSLLSVLATLGAAYIASSLFNDWKTEFNKNTENEYLKSALNLIREIHIIEKQCRIALELSDFSLKYGILKSLDNITLDKNNNKLVLLLNEYCKLCKDDDFKEIIESYNKFGLEYTFILSTIKTILQNVQLNQTHINFLENFLETTVQINDKNYKYKNIFYGLDITNIQNEIISRVFVK
ncbi:hypothetical protein [Acinetobacter sp.]|uniref:hypothetical protein n=1 Tax=Acinetobacter sp. TaxID=472 RepID=UPI0024879BFA|nr:hypothetical protein [Acinetobacter sp.]MDI1225220.1 hypothetical protein [Acinetobacter sp.]